MASASRFYPRQPLSPRISRGGNDRYEERPPASARLKRNDSSNLDRRTDYQVDAPRINRGRGEYDAERHRVPTYDQHRREEERRYQSRYDDRSSSHASVTQYREREDHDLNHRAPSYNPYEQPDSQYDKYAPKFASYDQHIREQNRRFVRAPYRSRIDHPVQPVAPVRVAPCSVVIQSSRTEQRSERPLDSVQTSGPSYLEKYFNTSRAVAEWEDSLGPDSGESDIDGMDEGPTLPFKGIPTQERPFCEARFMPLCRAIKACLNRSFYATADEVEERLLRDDVNVFHKIDLNSFRQYVFEAKKGGAPINFTQNVDDQITRLYFCLTRKMIDAASSVDQSTGTVAGPKLEPRYLPLYQAMRKCITDEGYSPGHIVEDTLMKDVLIYHKLGVDSFREYLQQARITRAPIDFPSDQDYIEKIWFCPTERMLDEPEQLRSRQESTLSNATGTTIGGDEDQQNEAQFCVMEEDEEDEQAAVDGAIEPPLIRQQETPPPETFEVVDEKDSKLGIVKIEADQYEFKVKEEPREATPLLEEESNVNALKEPDIAAPSPVDRRQETPEPDQQDAPAEQSSAAENNEVKTVVKTEETIEVKKEFEAIGLPEPSPEEILAMPISTEHPETYKVAQSLMRHHRDSWDPIAAQIVASSLEISVEKLKSIVDECNRFKDEILILWKPVSDARQAIITIKSFPRQEPSLRCLFVQ